jgi:hypothetical protein
MLPLLPAPICSISAIISFRFEKQFPHYLNLFDNLGVLFMTPLIWVTTATLLSPSLKITDL